MAVEKVINIRVNDSELNQLDSNLNKVSDGFNEVDQEAKKASKSVDDVAGNGGAIAILDSLTGGLATRFRDAYEASKLFNVSLKATRTALIATGIGAFVVALGLVVAYWGDIKDFITGSNRELENQLRLTNELADEQQRELDLLDKKDNILKLQGKSQLEINRLKQKELNDVIEIRQQELQLAKERLNSIIELREAGGSGLESIARISQNLFVGLGNAIDNLLSKVGLSTGFAETSGSISESIIEGLFGSKEDLEEAKKRVQELEDTIIQGQDRLAALTLQNQDIIAGQTDRSGELSSVSELSPEGLAEIEQAKILNSELENIEGARLETQRQFAEERKLIAEEEAQFKRDLIFAEADVLQQFGGLLQQLGEENKGLAIAGIVAEQIASTAKVIISTVEANAKAVAASPLTAGQPWVALNTISAGLGIASGVAAATKAISQLGGGGSVSGGSVPQAGGQAAPSFNVVGTSGTNQLAQSLAQDDTPIQAYVVGSNVTTQQALDRNIVETATIG